MGDFDIGSPGKPQYEDEEFDEDFDVDTSPGKPEYQKDGAEDGRPGRPPAAGEERVMEEGSGGGSGTHQLNRRIKEANLRMTPGLYVKEQQSVHTRKSTEYAVRLFNEVMPDVAAANSFEHQDLRNIDMDELPDRLAKFLMVVRSKDGSSFNSSTLGCIHNGLARYLATEYEPKIDIKKDVRFDIVTKNLKAAQKESCADGQRPGKHQSEPFSDKHIKQAWN